MCVLYVLSQSVIEIYGKLTVGTFALGCCFLALVFVMEGIDVLQQLLFLLGFKGTICALQLLFRSFFGFFMPFFGPSTLFRAKTMFLKEVLKRRLALF